MPDQLTAFPAEFRAGTTVTYRKSFADFPTSGYTLKVYLLGRTTISADAVIDGDEFVVTFAPAATGPLSEGTYRFVEQVTEVASSAVYEAAKGPVKVLLNPATVTAAGGQLESERMLSIINAVLEGKITDDVAAYTIAGRAVTTIPLTELWSLKRMLEAELANEQNPGGFGTPIHVAFNPTRL